MNPIDLKALPGIQLFQMQGRVALITGGSKGLGLVMAAALASAGAKIALLNRNLEEGQQAAAALSAAYGVEAMALAADVSDTQAVEAAVAQLMQRYGRIDVLINSAGINIRGGIEDLRLEDFQQVMDINVTGTWICSKAVVPHMRAAGYGKIINLSSALGLVGLSNRTPYCSSKGAVAQMTKALAIELAPHNINVNALCPGPFLTEMNIPIADTEEGIKFVVGATAMGRWGELKEIQGAALFLASEAANYMVGALLSVDGGWVAR